VSIATLVTDPARKVAAWRDRIILFAPMLAVIALSGVTEHGPTLCPFALVTGTACPGCGMTRAVAFLIRGDLDISSSYHPLAPLIAIEGIAAWAWYQARRKGLVGPMPRYLGNLVVILTAVSLLGVWALRFWSGSLPPV